jgi:hypothetical protein
MNDLTHNEVVRFFEGLDLTERVEILNELTGILHKDIHKETTSPTSVSDEDDVIDTLFGAWADEHDLNEEVIIDRTFSERDINLN